MYNKIHIITRTTNPIVPTINILLSFTTLIINNIIQSKLNFYGQKSCDPLVKQ
jgi:hypothetical protein